jgi:hypothetical protein
MTYKNFIFFILIIANIKLSFSQNTEPIPEKHLQYSSKNNQHYWKNRKPHESYWQQDVHYIIDAVIDEKTNIIHGKEKLFYKNNSPKTIDVIYFHLYQNAFQPESYCHHLHELNNHKPRYGKYEKEGKGTIINELKVNGQEVKTELDNTILKIHLNTPLNPGEHIVFDIKFDTYFDTGSMRRRMKVFNAYGNKHYDGVHWYPRISVFDEKFGWTTDQHLGKEFYGNFGSFEVSLNFADNFVVEATGELQNRNEVLPDDLRKKLDISNFANKPLFSAPSVITPYDPLKRKTWKFFSVNTHDFAFTADPTYRIGETEWNGIQCIALVQEPHAARWQVTADFTAKVIQVYSEDFGMYAYPKMVVADARDGMEYPMITLCGGLDPDNRGLIAHEVGHNWFQGMVGSNETYRAFMDEGFTQFLTSWSLEKIDGEEMKRTISDSKYVQRFSNPAITRDRNVYLGYINSIVNQNDAYLNSHSDDFNNSLRHGGGYGAVYYKAATMLYNLQYVLGDELFLKSMQYYFEKWKMANPYPEDFRQAIIEYSGVDLNWFFDQWLERKKDLDYAVGRIKKVRKEKNTYQINFLRKGEMQMPIDFVVIDANDSSYHYHIPNTWFQKNTNATILPKWTGWGKLLPKYTATVKLDKPIKDVIIDPSNRLADANMLNNSSKFNIINEFDHRLQNPPNWKNYVFSSRPDLWYNGYDGLKVGGHVNGNYMNKKHVFDLTFWYNTGLFQNPDISSELKNMFEPMHYRFNYKTDINKIIRKTDFLGGLSYLDGLSAGYAGFEKRNEKEDLTIYVKFKSMRRHSERSLVYLIHPNEWQIQKYNNIIHFGLNKNYDYFVGEGKINLNFRNSALGSDYNFSAISLEVKNNNNFSKIAIKTRFFAQYGIGKDVPYESSLYLSGANGEELMDNKYTRSVGFIDNAMQGYGTNINHFHIGGGLNLRGYAGYLAPTLDNNGNIVNTYRGLSGAAVNVEIDFAKLIPLKFNKLKRTFNIDTYAFADAGMMDISNSAKSEIILDDLRADAGLGLALSIKKFGPLQKVKPLTIRLDMPFFVNRIPAVNDNYFAFRWMVGINRAF